MQPMLWFSLVGAVLVVAAVVAVRLIGGARRRYATLLAAVELCQRQLTELRTVVGEQAASIAGLGTLLEQTVAPGVSRLERARALSQVARELERSAERGDLDGEAAAALCEQLELLEAEVLASGHGE